jgi:formylglycine-generating enzyme required for sulfatase activity
MRDRLAQFPALNSYLASLRAVPAGTFTMGSDSGDSDEKPPHRVQVSAFRIGATPVTVRVWKEYCVTNRINMPDPPKWGWIDDHPIVRVRYEEIESVDNEIGFCSWVRGIAGIRLMLPSEAQFEYAMRGGIDGLAYPWGNKFDRSKLWCSNTSFGDAMMTASVFRTTNVFQNSFGLTDMCGNVSQWCRNDYDSYAPKSRIDSNRDRSYPKLAMCVRGGAWNNLSPERFRCANRSWEDYTGPTVGFRLCAQIEPRPDR